MASEMDIYRALRGGADDAALNEVIRELLSSARRTADDHGVWGWRRDNYLDLRRWAGPAAEEYIAVYARIAAGGALAAAGAKALAALYRRRLAAELRFPIDPYVPAPDPVETPEVPE